MIECSKRCNRLLIEAVWTRWHPRFRRIVELVESGAIGEIKSIVSQWGFKSEMTENYRLDPLLGGGALLDIGCYQANMWVAVTNGAKELLINKVERKVGPTKIDLTTEVDATIDGKVKAHLVSSFEKDMPQILKIEGSSGIIATAAGEAFSTWREPSSLRVNDNIENFEQVDAFVEMIQQVGEQIASGSGWVMPTSDSLRTAQILDKIIES
jgi:predicted dehydrogenase